MTFTLNTANALGLIAVGLTFASFVMKSMMPLRALALASNVCFIAYGYMESLLPSLILNGVLLPLNAARLWEIKRLSNEITRATQTLPVSEWLLPHMTRSSFKAGEVLFRKGDVANRLYYVVSGRLRLVEADRLVEPQTLIGEVGLFSPKKTRTQTTVCETDGELYWMTDAMIFRLYYQNPKLGFYLMRLVAERLLEDVQRQQGKPVAV